MPSLHVRYRPLEEGWSKPQEDDLIEKLFSATFPAFKFPDRERLHVSCGVQLCKQQCPDVSCRADDNFLLTSEQNLARIEVFNSLAVTAPQIEIDRYNMSGEFVNTFFSHIFRVMVSVLLPLFQLNIDSIQVTVSVLLIFR